MQELAPAKINLYLKILNKRKDGFHNILSVFQTVSLFDKIKVRKIFQDKIILKCNIKSLESEHNLCYKVAQELKKRYNIKQGVVLKLTKNIPLGSGLGGASSDALTTAKLLIKLWDIRISEKNFLNFCAKIGKDVPFFYYRGCCIVKGAGEKVFKINPWWEKENLWIILAYPNKILHTKDVYNKFDEMCKNKIIKKSSFQFTIDKFLKRDSFNKFLYNDLYLPASEIYPRLSFIKDEFIKNGCNLVSMSGSGSTIFGVFYKKNDAQKTKKILENKLENLRVELVKTIF